MTQHRASDTTLIINGETRTLRLTLGALAALEEKLGQGDFATLAKKLETPRVADMLIILEALLQGGGAKIPLATLRECDIDLGAAARAIGAAFRALAPIEAEARDG